MEDTMRRINLTIDEALYEKARRASFLTRRPISELVRNALEEWFINHPFNSKGELVLTSEDEREILEILDSGEFIGLEEVEKELGFTEDKGD
jgi:hypothetical protein